MVRKRIIIINGSDNDRRDTFIDFCRIYCNAMNVSIIDKIKEAAKVLGWDGNKNKEDDNFLGVLKLLSTKYNDFSYKYIKQNIRTFMDDNSVNILFVHSDNIEEIDRIKKEFDAITLFLQNENENIEDNDYNYDYTIINNYDLADIKQKAISFICNIK